MTIQRPGSPRTLLHLLLLTLTPLVLADCYYANNTLITGAEADNYKECEDSGACCYKTETCLPNKLCVRSSLFSRQACQYKQWPQDKCSQLCFEEGAGTALTTCPNGRVCCGSENTNCCESGGGVLIDLYGDVVEPITMTIVSTASATSPAPLQFSGTHIHGQTPGATSGAVESASASSSDGDTATQMTPGVIGGIAAGAVAVVLALVVLAWVFVRERKRKIDAGWISDRDLKKAGFSARERGGDYKAGYSSASASSSTSPVGGGLRGMPRGHLRVDPRETRRFELDGVGFGSEEAVGRGKF